LYVENFYYCEKEKEKIYWDNAFLKYTYTIVFNKWMVSKNLYVDDVWNTGILELENYTYFFI